MIVSSAVKESELPQSLWRRLASQCVPADAHCPPVVGAGLFLRRTRAQAGKSNCSEDR